MAKSVSASFRQLIFGGIVVLLSSIVAIIFWNSNQDPTVFQEVHLDEKDRGNIVAVDNNIPNLPAEPNYKTLIMADGSDHQNWCVYGIVTDKASGDPIQDALVQLFFDAKGEYEQPQLEKLSDAEGEYGFVLTAEDIPQVNLAVGVQAEGWASDIISVLPRKRKGQFPKHQEINFALDPGKTISGRVEDQYQNPVGGAVVGVTRQNRNSIIPLNTPFEAFPTVLSGDTGNFQLPGVPAEENDVQIIGRAEGYVSGICEVAPEIFDGVLVVLRPREASLSGRVIDSDDMPVTNIPVQIKHGGKKERVRWSYTLPGTTITQATFTDDEGYYCFPEILSGWQILSAGYGPPISCSSKTTVFIEPNESKVCNLRILTPVTLRGKFVDGKTKAPVAGVRVTNIPEDDDLESQPREMANLIAGGVGLQETVSGMDGSFTITLNRFAGYSEWNSRPCLYYKVFEPYQKVTDDWVERRLDPASTEEEIVINLYPPKFNLIKGIVYETDGTTPVFGAKVMLGENVSNDMSTIEEFAKNGNFVLTESDGSYEISTLKNYFTIMALNENGFSQKQIMMQGSNEMELNLSLRGYISVLGLVVNSDNHPVSDVKLSLSQTFPFSPDNVFCMPHGSEVSTLTEIDGTYSFQRMPGGGGHLTVEVVPSEKGYLVPPKKTFSVSGDQTAFDDVDFVLPAAISFEGLVVDEDEEPIKGAIVTQKAPWRPDVQVGSNISKAETDEEGKFFFDDLSEEQGVYHFVASYSGYNEAIIDDRVLSDSPLTMVMTKMASVEVSVYKEESTPVTDFEYSFEKKVEQVLSQEVSHISYHDDHHFNEAFNQIEPLKQLLSAGEYTLHVYELDTSLKRTGLYGTVDFFIESGTESKEIEVLLVSEINISGLVLSKETNQPLSGVIVDLVFPSSNPIERCVFQERTGSDGTFSFTSVKNGSYSLEATKEKLVQTETIELIVSQGETIGEQTIYLSKGATLYGVVTDSDGNPFKDGRVLLTNLDRQKFLITAIYFSDGGVGMNPQMGGLGKEYIPLSENGEYRFETLPPGRMELRLNQEDQFVLKEEVTIGTDEVMEYNIDLRGLIEVSGKTPEIPFPSHYVENLTKLLLVSEREQYLVPVNYNGTYSCSIVPGNYQVYLRVFDAKITVHTGQQLTIDETPVSQEHDLLFPIEAVDVVITSETDESSMMGTLTYIHESQAGMVKTNSFFINKPRFTLYNQPHGRCRGEFVTNEGREFVSQGWMEINEGSEKILTLMPKDLTEE
jgi:protocatechuate 3,4-dioxygenase beta subunit